MSDDCNDVCKIRKTKATATVWPVSEAASRAAHAAGRRAWPRVALPPDVFHEHLVRALGPAPSWNWSLRADDLYLCCACALGVHEAHRALEQLLRDVRRTLRSRSQDSAMADEVLQRLRAKLLVGSPPRIATYQARGPLLGWLGVIAIRIAIELRRVTRRESSASPELYDVDTSYDPDLTRSLLTTRYADSFAGALRAAALELTEADRALLRRAFVDGCSVDQLGLIYSVHRATAARRVQRARTRLLDALRLAVQFKHRFSEDDFDSIARDVSDHVDFSCEHLFAERAAS